MIIGVYSIRLVLKARLQAMDQFVQEPVQMSLIHLNNGGLEG